MNEQHENTIREDYSIFIDKNTEKYLTKFEKFNVNGTDKFAVTWHWPAFFFPFFWALYRKLYLLAFIVFLMGSSVEVIARAIIPYAGFLVSMVIFGITANYIYYQHMKKKLSELPYTRSETQRGAAIARAGGVKDIIGVLFIPVIGIIAAIAVPNLPVALQRSKRNRTVADMRAIGTALGSFQVDNNQFPIQQTEGNLSNEILPGSYYQGVFHDGWGTSFRYVTDSDGTTYKLMSYGKDKKEGKGDTEFWTEFNEFDEDIIYSDGRFIAPEKLR